MKLITLLAVLLFTIATNGQKKDTVGYAKQLIGEWRMKDKSFSAVKFTNVNEFDYFQGSLMATYDYKLEGDTLISVDKKSGEVYKYLIETLTKDNLTLKFVRTGNTLKFIREKLKISN